MNILFDHQIFVQQKFGGISRYVVGLANALVPITAGRVRVFAPVHKNGHLAPAHNRFLHHGFKASYDKGKMRRRVDALNHIFGKCWIRPSLSIDIFHETYYARQTYCPESAIRVTTVHDMIHEKFPSFFNSVSRLVEEKAAAIKRADHVICVSETTRRDLLEHTGVDETKVSVVHLSPFLCETGVAPNVHANPHPADGRPFVLYVGPRKGYKNFERALSAFSKSTLPSDGYALYCFGGGALTRYEIELAGLLNLAAGQVVQVEGDDATLLSLYRNAECLIYPSLYEGFGLPPLEAMALGCPVISASAGSMPEVLGDAPSYFDPYSENDIRACLEKVVLSEVAKRELRERGFQRVRQYTASRMAEKTLAIYRSVCR